MIRILFVDDEVNVLQAMQRAMHSMRTEWSMEFVSSGTAALGRLAQSPADVIVTDMRMPGMDGWQLLTQVKNLYPQSVRLVLSGHADPGAIMRSVGTAHQYIAKPCDSGTLKAAVAQSQMLRLLLSNDGLARLVGNIDTLPSCPKAFQDISTCLRQPNASMADAAHIISRDVAMTANVMKLVNSAFFGIRRSITSVDRAVAYLGMDTLGALVLGHSLFQTGANVIEGFSLEQLWQHCLQTAMAARTIARYEKLGVSRAEEAFLTGLIHDVGKVVFATRGATAAAANGSEDIAALMEEHHPEVGAYLLGLWGFPSHIVEAVALHHAPGRRADPGFDLTALVHIANRLAHCPRDPSSGPAELGIEAGLLEKLGLSSHLPQWLAALDALEAEQAPT
jgi:putative nucleotidyltransferase with HDIG domain